MHIHSYKHWRKVIDLQAKPFQGTKHKGNRVKNFLDNRMERIWNTLSLSLWFYWRIANNLFMVHTATYCTGMCNFRVSCTLHSYNCKKNNKKKIKIWNTAIISWLNSNPRVTWSKSTTNCAFTPQAARVSKWPEVIHFQCELAASSGESGAASFGRWESRGELKSSQLYGNELWRGSAATNRNVEVLRLRGFQRTQSCKLWFRPHYFPSILALERFVFFSGNAINFLKTT